VNSVTVRIFTYLLALNVGAFGGVLLCRGYFERQGEANMCRKLDVLEDLGLITIHRDRWLELLTEVPAAPIAPAQLPQPELCNQPRSLGQ